MRCVGDDAVVGLQYSGGMLCGAVLVSVRAWRLCQGLATLLPCAVSFTLTLQDMQSTLIARGPSFVHGGATVESTANIHLYSLICRVLNMNPAPNNGSIAAVEDMLRVTQ